MSLKPGYLVSGRFTMIDGRPSIIVENLEPGALEPGETFGAWRGGGESQAPSVVEIPEGATVAMRTPG